MGKDSLEVKTIVKVKSLRIIAATAGRFYESVSMFLEKRKKSLVVAPKWFNNGFWRVYSSIYIYIRQKDDSQFRDITYTRSITESRNFLKRNNFSYTGCDTDDTNQTLV